MQINKSLLVMAMALAIAEVHAREQEVKEAGEPGDDNQTPEPTPEPQA